MPDRETNGLRILDKMLIGADALQWSQDERVTRDNATRLAMTREPGWFAEWVGGHPNIGWEVYDAGTGTLATRSEFAGVGSPFPINRSRPVTALFAGVDPSGNLLEVDPSGNLLDDSAAPGTVVVPNDGVWYTLQGAHHLDVNEPGTLTITGASTTVVGVRTRFTRLADSSEPEATRIRIPTGPNAGTYTVATITNDTSMILTAAPPTNESGVYFRVRGQFSTGTPADTDIHNSQRVAWSLETRTTTRPSTGLIAYDVRRSGGVTTLIDRRRGSIWSPWDGRSEAIALSPVLTVPDAATSTVEIGRVAVYSHATDVVGALAIAPASIGSHRSTGINADQPTGLLAAVLLDEGATNRIRAKVRAAVAGWTEDWENPDGVSTDIVGPTATIANFGVALLALPVNGGSTHACFYLASAADEILLKTSGNQGSSWGGAVSIFGPAAPPILGISAVLTRMGRIVLAIVVDATPTIRYIYSDDLGTTWNTNGTAGHTLASTADVPTAPAIVEDDRGNLWTAYTRASAAGAGAKQPVRMLRGGSEGVPAPSAAEQTGAGWFISAEVTDFVGEHIGAVALPNGVVVVLYDLVDSTAAREARIYASIVGRDQALAVQAILGNAETAAGATSEVAATVDAAGIIHLLWAGTTGIVNYVNHIRLIPSVVQRAASWYGGA